tara:strand:- start:702 stop:1529 length:828 start_codon:yes stop_codon:yes gene_type:complete
MAKTTIPAGYFAAGSIATADIAANAITSAKLAQNSVLTKHIDDNQIGIDQLNVSDGSNGQALVTNGSGTLSFASVGVTGISSSADATAITITSAEKVGIGSTSPNVALEVHDDVSAGVCLELKNSNVQGYSGIHFRNNSDTLVGHVGYGNPSASNSVLQDLVYFGSITSTDVGFTSADTVRLKLTSAGHLVPTANNSYDLGSATLGFRNIYTNDLNLSNMAPEGVDADGNAYTRPGNDVDGTNGSWTIQEGADDLFIINRTNGKKYRFNLTEVTD